MPRLSPSGPDLPGASSQAATARGLPAFARLPRHIGFIPDGNRRWADARGIPRREGYAAGIEPGLALIETCRALRIAELSIYGFTKENVCRAADQVAAFQRACIDLALRAADAGAALLAVGDANSRAFPAEFRAFTTRSAGDVRVNLLVNYNWQWDLGEALKDPASSRNGRKRDVVASLGSREVSRVDLVVRWGGRQRLSGFLPLQSAYADVRVIDTLWPDMAIEEFLDVLRWYEGQDVTMGG